MKVTIYIDWANEKVYTQRDIQEMVAEEVSEMVADKDQFSSWLEDYFPPNDIFYFTQEQKEQVFDEWHEYCKEYVKDGVLTTLSERILDV